MKVLFLISQVYQLGGAEKLSYDLSLSLSARGYSVGVGLIYSHPDEKCTNIKNLIDSGIDVFYFNHEVSSPKYKIFQLASKLRKIVGSQEYSHIETGTVIPTIISLFSGVFLKVKFIVGIHQVYNSKREKGLNYFFYKILLACKSNLSLYYISNYVKIETESNFLLRKRPSYVIYNAIRDEFFNTPIDNNNINESVKTEITQGLNSNKVILYCGRFAEYKGVGLVYDTFKKVFSIHQNITLVFLGAVDNTIPGTQDVLKNINKDIQENKLSRNVFFCSHREDVIDIMKEASVLIHPTRIEGFGLSLVEASALGLPVVTSMAEAIPEILAGTTATLLDDYDVDYYALAVVNTLNKPYSDRINEVSINRACLSKFSQEFRVIKFIEVMLN